MKQWAPHGTVRRYRQGGCDDTRGGAPGAGDRCLECKSAMSDFGRERRAGFSGRRVGTNVTSLAGRRNGSNAAGAPSNIAGIATNPDGSQPNMDRAMGATEAAVYEQLEQYRVDNPVRVEMALTAARILDDPERVTLHTPTMRQMNEIIDKLTVKKKTKSGGRLASVQAMVGRKSG